MPSQRVLVDRSPEGPGCLWLRPGVRRVLRRFLLPVDVRQVGWANQQPRCPGPSSCLNGESAESGLLIRLLGVRVSSGASRRPLQGDEARCGGGTSRQSRYNAPFPRKCRRLAPRSTGFNGPARYVCGLIALLSGLHRSHEECRQRRQVEHQRLLVTVGSPRLGAESAGGASSTAVSDHVTVEQGLPSA